VSDTEKVTVGEFGSPRCSIDVESDGGREKNLDE
jgi:hypothetical protein